MKISFNPSNSNKNILDLIKNNKDIIFDLKGHSIFARGVEFKGTDTNTWRDIKINNVSIGSHTLDLRNGSNTTLTNTNGVVTINSTWRPVVDNLTSDSTTSSLSAKQGKVLKALIDGKSNSGHTHDDRYLKLTGGTMAGNALITFADSGSWSTDKGLQGARGGLYWTGQSDYAKLYAEETAGDNLDLVIQFGDDNSNGLSIRNKANTQTSYISAGGVITTGTFKGNLDWSYITNKPSSYTPSAHTHAWNSLTHSSTTENQAILTNGKANGWKLQTLNIARWDNAANNAHSHANKSVLDGITSALVNSWNTAYNFVSNITGTDTDKVINKWEEIVNFLAGITEDNKLNTLLNSKLSVYELADNTNVGTIKNNGIYYSTTDASSRTLINSPFNTGFAFINMTSYDGGDDLRRSRLAFNAFGEIKVSDDRDQANTAETWYNVLTSKNSGINGSTIKLNGTSITVYSSGTADGRYVKKSGDTMSGVLTIDTTNFGALTIKRNDDANGASIQFRGKSSVYGYIGLNNSTKDKQFLRWSSDISRVYTILDTSSTYISNGKGVINGTTITQVDNATNSTNSTNARKLVNWYSARPTSLNAQFGDGSLRIFYATSSTTEGKPAEDSHILHLAWDNTGGFDAQLAVHARSGKVSTRAQNGGTWQPWKTLAFITDIPTSLKNPYSFNVFGVVYDGSAAKTVTTSTFVSQLPEGASTVTDGTMFITSWASNSGFADTNAVNVPYKRKAIHLWEYIKAKTDSLYATKGHNHDGKYLKLTGGTMLGALNFANNTWNLVGGDSYIGDCNISGHFGIKAANTTYPGITFFNNASTFLGNLTAYSGNIKYGAYSLQFLDNGNTSVSASTWTNPFSNYNSNAVADGQAICVWGQSSYLSNLSTDTGGMSLWLKRINANVATLNMVLDGEYYANGYSRLAHVSEIPTSLKNPYALTISLNGTSQGPYDGSAAKNINITPGSIGAAVSNHSHDYLVVNSADDKSFNSAYHNFQVLYAGGGNGITGKPANVDAFGLFKFRAASGWSGQMLLANGGSLYIRSSEDAKMTNTLAWKTILDSSNYSGILDSRYYTESEVNSLLDAKLNRQNLSYGTWNPRGYHLAADYHYNGGDLSISENNGKMYISVDGYFWQNEGQYRVLDTSDIGDIRDSVTLHQYLSATDAAWYPLVWGGNAHQNTSDSTGAVYKSYDKLSWQTSSQTLYTTRLQTTDITFPNSGTSMRGIQGTVGDNDAWRIKGGATASNSGYLEIATADDGNEPIYVRQYTGTFSTIKRTLTLLDTNGFAHFPSYINIGGNENNNSSPDRVWGSNSSDSYLRSYRTSALRVAYAVNANSAITASSANKLTTARNIALGMDLRGSANFDGSGNITINANINACTIIVDSTNGLPFKRIAHFETGGSWNDSALLLYISQGYINGSNGICRVEFRTDDISSSSTSITASAAVRWLVRNGYGLDSLYAGYYVTAGKAYIDIYLKTTKGYQGTVIRVLQDKRGGITSKVQLINSYYYSDTKHKEAYNSIEAASTALYNRAYTRIVSGSDIGTVSYSNSTGSVHWNNVTNKPSTFNPAAHTHTVFKNNLMIKGTNGISDSASIHLGIGDSDTGFKWISDGVCQIYANNVAVGQWTSGGMNWFKNPTVNGNKVWNAGNDGSGSGLDADTLDGEHASSFVRAGHYESQDLNKLDTYSFIRSVNSNVSSTSPKGNTGWYNVIQLVHRNGAGDGPSYIGQIALGMTTNTNDMFFRGNRTDPWKTVIHSGNIGNQTVANAYHLRINSANTWSTWYWAGQSGQPSWLWGSNDGTNMYVWNPSNFNVNTAQYLRSLGNQNCQTGRTQAYGDVYTYNTYDGNTGSPTTYSSVIGFGRGIAGTVEIAGGWGYAHLYWRSLRDCCDDWSPWRTVLDSSNYTKFINNYYWANVKISTSSSTTTSPTVSNLTATSSIRMSNISLEHTDEINNITNGGIHLNYRNSGNVSLCYGGGNVGIGATTSSYKLDVNGQMRASGFHHASVNSDNYMLLAGGGYKSFGGDDSTPIFLGYLTLYHGNDGTISSTFTCVGKSVPFTYTRGGNYCRINIPNTSFQSFYIKAAIASVCYSGVGMDHQVGNHRGDGTWWLHCEAVSDNIVQVQGFHPADAHNDSWWGGNPLYPGDGAAKIITVCLFGYVLFK